MASSTKRRIDPTVLSRAMQLSQAIDDHFLDRYRALLDAEDEAFDELEHAYEDGDRTHFEEEIALWQQAIVKRYEFLRNKGIEIPGLGAS